MAGHVIRQHVHHPGYLLLVGGRDLARRPMGHHMQPAYLVQVGGTAYLVQVGGTA
jgi:hypothetical protein